MHGSPIGNAEADKLRETLNWTYKPFEVPEDVYQLFRKKVTLRGQRVHRKWKKLFEAYQEQYADDAKLLNQFINDDMLVNEADFEDLAKANDEATRSVSGKVIQRLSNQFSNLIGGSADLTVSTKAKGADGHYDRNNRLGRNINFGVREHAMGAIVNGLTLHGGLKAFSGAFFVFSDYMKPAIRLAAIMNIPSIFVFTHDSIAVGEDGPTHQPVEHLAGLRSIPNLNVIRPADVHETIAAWKVAIESKHTPTVIVLTRQNVKNYQETNAQGLSKGAYIVSKENNQFDGILLATGSEVELAMKAKEILKDQGVDVRVVSMPSHHLFEKQTKKYQKEILPKRKKTLAIEMGSSMSWYKYTKDVYGLDTFGASAPMEDVLEHFNFTAEKVTEAFLKI